MTFSSLCVKNWAQSVLYIYTPLSLLEQPSPPPLSSWSSAIYDKWMKIYITGKESKDLVILEAVLPQSKAFSSTKTSDSYSISLILSVGWSKGNFNCLIHKFKLTCKGLCHSYYFSPYVFRYLLMELSSIHTCHSLRNFVTEIS